MVYPETKGTVEATNYVTFDLLNSRLQWYDERMRDAQRKIRLLVRILVDKKIIGDELAKTFEETNSSEVLSWFLEKHKDK